MNKTRLLAVLIVLLSVGGMLFAAGGQEVKSESKALEDKVTMYASITGIEPVIETFNSESGITAEVTRLSTANFVSTVLTEFAAGKLQADVLQAPLPVLEILKDQGVIKDYVSPIGETYPEWTRNNGGIYQFGIEYVALIYNTELVKAEDVPKRYEDICDPKWKGKIVMANPASHATTISWLVGLKENNVFGSEENWYAFLEGLAANSPMFVKSFGPTPAPIESGEMLIGISMPKYIITKAPAPLGWAHVEQPLFGSPRAIAITADSPHPNAAEAFMEFWLSDKTTGILSEQVGEYVLTPGVYPPIEGIKDADVRPIRDLSDEEIISWGAKFEKIFAAK
ncbi:MAG: extracellular solute-binding protein [Sphaerochaetaceae bacterium]|jgi:iron(III) transport system substrate-binding protein|nr:extracellular solute-binding protein [Sphaerochaetaceae bacterium]